MAEEPQMDSLRADLLEAQQSEAEARAALQQSAEYGKLLLSRNEALEQELEVLRQELGRKVAAEVSHRSRLEEECRRLEQELETKSKPQERHGYSRTSRLLSLSGSLDSDEEPNVAQMQQRLKRCEKNEQEHREAAWLAEEHANMLEEQNQKLEEEGRRLQAQLTRSRPNDEVVQRWQKAGSLVRDSLRDTEEMEISEKGLGRSLQGQVGHIHSNGGSAPTSPRGSLRQKIWNSWCRPCRRREMLHWPKKLRAKHTVRHVFGKWTKKSQLFGCCWKKRQLELTPWHSILTTWEVCWRSSMLSTEQQ